MSGELVLTREQTPGANTIVVDTDSGPVCVTVKSIRGDRVRLGVVAPPDCPVMRGELQRLDGSRYDEEFTRR